MSGIFHQYYNVALAPYIAALIGMGTVLLWRRRTHVAAAAVLAATVAGTAVWAYALLDRSPDWHPWLRVAVVAAGLAAALGLLAGTLPGMAAVRAGARLGVLSAVVALAAVLGGPVAYTLDTVGTGHEGSIVTAGPAVQGGRGGPGGGFGGGGRPGGFGGAGGQGRTGQGLPGQGGGARQFGGNGVPPTAGGGQGFQGGQGQSGQGQPGQGFPAGGGTGAPGGGAGGGMSGLLQGAQVSAAMKSLLLADAGRYTWVAAAIGSQNQASYQLATGKPVMAVGGFNGSDPSPTLAQFEKDVSAGRIHYFIGGGARAARAGAAWAVPAPPPRSPPGSRATSPPSPWAARPSTT